MSTFAGWSSALIPLGDTVAQAQGIIVTAMTTAGWQCLRQGLAPTSVGGSITNPNNALDMIASTIAGEVGTASQTIAVQISGGFTPTALYMQAPALLNYATTLETDMPTSVTIEYSDTSLITGFTVLQTFTPANWGPQERRKFTITGAGSHQYWRSTVSGATTNMYFQEWCLEDSSTPKNWITNQQFADFIPPVTETIGNSYARDVLRMYFNAVTITMQPVQELLTALPMVLSFDTATGGAVTLQVSNGTNVQFVGSGGNTSQQNARGLYNALAASVDANFTAWNWIWPTPLVGTVGAGQIIAVQKTPAASALMTSSNITTRYRGCYASPAGPQGCGLPTVQSITTDLTNGFIYYLQVCSRGIALATKTNAGYYGPVHACYGDNASTLSQLPTADLAAYGLPCTPIELVIGTDDVAANSDGTGRFGHWWGVAAPFSSAAVGAMYLEGVGSAGVWSKLLLSGQLSDVCCNAGASSYLGGALVTAYGEGILDGGAASGAGGIYPIHRLSAVSALYNNYLATLSPNVYGMAVTPSFANLDWYKYTGTGPSSEQLMVAPSNDFTTTITSAVAAGDVTINVASTTGFPTSGWLVIDGEIIQYAGGGGGGTQFTGCTRAKYATTALAFPVGTTVFIGGWYCIFNTGLLFGGYQTPT